MTDGHHRALRSGLGLELMRVTERAALAAAPWIGRGSKEDANTAAIDAMHGLLRTVDVDGVIVFGEGDASESPLLFDGEQVGAGHEPRCDVAIDAIDGLTPTASGRPNAISVIALVERGSMIARLPCTYVNKLAVGAAGVGVVDITRSATHNLEALADASGRPIRDLTAVVLDRPRHADLIAEIQRSSARLRLVTDDDVGAAVSTALDDAGADVLFGIGGARAAVLSAVAVRGLAGEQQIQLRPRGGAEERAMTDAGFDTDSVLTMEDLLGAGESAFAATGITHGDVLPGVRYDNGTIWTHSLVVQTGDDIVRRVRTRHRPEHEATRQRT